MRIIISTCKIEEADMIAETLLKEKLIASCNIVTGVKTKVRFKDELLTQEEALLIMRTRTELVWQLEGRICELNSFEIPEVAALDVKEWNDIYLKWIYDSTDPSK